MAKGNPILPVLPVDVILTEIFTKLPPKSLMRFKCLSKFFQTSISSKEFTDLHLRLSLSSNTNSLLILKRNKGSYGSVYYSLDIDFPNTRVIRLPNPQNYYISKDMIFVGCFNGLICYVNWSNNYNNTRQELVILNPFTRLYKCGISIIGCRAFGFGYDSINDDYKIVGYKDSFVYEDEDHYVAEVMVFSVKANSWRCIEKIHTTYTVHSRHLTDSCIKNGVLVKNNLVHLMFARRSRDRLRLGCFNLETEQWTDDLPLPQFDFFYDIQVINGCLGIFTEDDPGCYLWVMEEYGVKESWVKLISPYYYFRPHSGCLVNTVRPAYRRETKREELLSVARERSSDGFYYWYNPKDGTYNGRVKEIPCNFEVIASTIKSLVNIV